MNQGRALARFRAIERQLPQLLASLVACPPHFAGRSPIVPHVAGVYLFTENGTHRYVGRTRNFNRRLGQHTRVSSPENSAPFAYNIARNEARAAGYSAAGRRSEVAKDPTFDFYFKGAKDRVRAMEFRFVQIENDAALSTVFEVYASLALGTEGEFNLFETH